LYLVPGGGLRDIFRRNGQAGLPVDTWQRASHPLWRRQGGVGACGVPSGTAVFATSGSSSGFGLKGAIMTRLFALVAAVLAASSADVLAQDVSAGEQSFRKCLPCHSVGEDAKNKVGPVLNGLEGRKSGTIEGYNYSEANKNSGITWSETVFKEYIKDPKAKIPGTKMVFAGIKNEKEINDLWAFLSQYDKDGKTK
jgi:cytochrome c